ncbi:HET domain containing protein [Hyaloscypha variabilis]
MRLINTKTMQLEDFTVRNIPEYAILSHTWTEEEVTFQELTGRNDTFIKKAGYAKVLQTCILARANDIKYAWVDTCCIDKTSSAELTEAINSMFRWYKNASVCYAYLSDLPSRNEMTELGDRVTGNDSTIGYDELRACKWFTRGWTLQELIAPKTVQFYDQNWTFRGTKADFADNIHRFTQIDPLVLQGGGKLTILSIAERMTWASRRKTTRIEDTAYCLLGIFDINIPLLYGEGEKAFTRLQQEIVKNNSDLSIFGWSPEERSNAAGSLGPRVQIVVKVDFHAGPSEGCEVNCGHGDNGEDSFYNALAETPAQFATPSDWDILSSVEHSVTNRGIKIYCSLLEICLGGCDFYECRCCSDQRKYVLVIGRTKTTFYRATHEYSWGIVLDKISLDTFVRSRKRLVLLDQRTKMFVSETRQRAIYLLTQPPHSTQPSEYLPLRNSGGVDFIIHSATPDYRWNSCTRSWYIERDSSHDWGMVSLEFSDLTNGRRVCVLFRGSSGQVFVLDPSIYGKEIGQISQSPSVLTSSDVYNVFMGENLRRNAHKMAIGDQGMKIVATVGNPDGENWALDVRIEDDEGNEAASRVSPTPSDSPLTHYSHVVQVRPAPIEHLKIGKVDTFSGPGGSPQQPPASKTSLQPASATSQWAVSASAGTHTASGSIQAVIVRCQIERRKHEFCSATRIRADHPVFSQPLLAIPVLVEIPMVMHRLGTQSANRSDLQNRMATWLNIAPESGFAPMIWQDNVGTVIVARKDRKPLLPQHLVCMFDYCGRIMDSFSNGNNAPIKRYNRFAFEKWWQDYFGERRQAQLRANELAKAEGGEKGEEDVEDWISVKSPYEV